MRISSNDDNKQNPLEKETNKVSNQSVDAIEFQLFQLMTGNTASNSPPNKSAELLKRVANVENMRDSLKGSSEKNTRLNLVITVADQWIQAKKAEAKSLED